MTLRRTVEPAIEPVTVAEVKIQCRIDDSLQDDAIGVMIQAAREECEDRLQRTLITSTWTLTLDTFPDAIRLPMPRVINVSGLTYRDIDGATVVLDPDDYEVDILSEPGYIVPAYGAAWPATYGGVNNITVTYTAGYGDAADDVPAKARQWMLLAIGDMARNKERSSDKPVVAQDFADGLLDSLKVYG